MNCNNYYSWYQHAIFLILASFIHWCMLSFSVCQWNIVCYNKKHANKWALYRKTAGPRGIVLKMSLTLLTSQSCRPFLVCTSLVTKICLSTETATTSLPELPTAPSSHTSPSFLYDPVSQYVAPTTTVCTSYSNQWTVSKLWASQSQDVSIL